MRKTAWKAGLLSLHQTLEALKEKQPLRHGNPLVHVSDIAEQFYCEKKVELTYKLGRVETQAMQEGAKLHEEITKMDKATLQRIIEGIVHRPFYSARFGLAAEVEELPVVGVPDVLGFLAGRACFVLELKTFGTRIFRLYPNHAVQAKLYGLLLEAMGFDCSKLLLYVAGVKRGINAEVSGNMLTRLLFTMPFTLDSHSLSKTVYISKEQISLVANYESLLKLFGLDKLTVRRFVDLTSDGDLSIFCFPYRRDDALEALRWAKGYWLRDRDAVPTRKPEKCRVCNFAENCPTHRL